MIVLLLSLFFFFFFQAEDGIRDLVRSRGLGDVYKRQVPFVSVYSHSDGFLDWRLSLDAAAEHVEVDCTHFGLAASIPAFAAIAHALTHLDG